MDIMVAPKPIFDRYKEVKGYYLAYQIGNALIEAGKPYSLENSIDSPFFDFINDIGLAALTDNKMIFVPVTNVLLATDLEHACHADLSLVVLLLGSKIELSEANLQRVARFKQLGFKIAFRHYSDINVLKPFYPYIDYIFCGNETAEVMSALGCVKRSGHPIKIIASEVDSNDTFSRVSAFNVELFRGDFYSESIKKSSTAPVAPLKINYLHLLNQVNQDDFDLETFAGIVQRDTALAIQFLKMVNSTSVRSNKITSLKHAAALLGQTEIKKWATTAVSSLMGQQSPGEITRLSMMRAKFCENLAGLFGMGAHSDNLYLMGLFSVLDVILDMTMEKSLTMLFVPDKVSEALMNGDNEFSKVFQFIKDYEKTNWSEISRIALLDNLSIADIGTAYREALAWYGRMISMSVSDLETGEELDTAPASQS